MPRVQGAFEHVVDGFKTGSGGKPVFSPLLMEWLQDAWLIGSVELHMAHLRSGVLFMALAENLLRTMVDEHTDQLNKIRLDEFREQFYQIS